MHNGVIVRKRFTLFTSLICNASARVKSIRSTNLAIRYPSSALPRGLFLAHNQYDGHTIEASLAQVERLTRRKIKIPSGDRGYRGKKEINGTQILIPDGPKSSDSRYQKRKKHKLFCKRAGIEPTIGHLKSDHRLGRNFYKGLAGDAVNILLAAAAYNFKRAMRVLLNLLKRISEMLRERASMNDFSLSNAF